MAFITRNELYDITVSSINVSSIYIVRGSLEVTLVQYGNRNKYLDVK